MGAQSGTCGRIWRAVDTYHLGSPSSSLQHDSKRLDVTRRVKRALPFVHQLSLAQRGPQHQGAQHRLQIWMIKTLTALLRKDDGRWVSLKYWAEARRLTPMSTLCMQRGFSWWAQRQGAAQNWQRSAFATKQHNYLEDRHRRSRNPQQTAEAHRIAARATAEGSAATQTSCEGLQRRSPCRWTTRGRCGHSWGTWRRCSRKARQSEAPLQWRRMRLPPREAWWAFRVPGPEAWQLLHVVQEWVASGCIGHDSRSRPAENQSTSFLGAQPRCHQRCNFEIAWTGTTPRTASSVERATSISNCLTPWGSPFLSLRRGKLRDPEFEAVLRFQARSCRDGDARGTSRPCAEHPGRAEFRAATHCSSTSRRKKSSKAAMWRDLLRQNCVCACICRVCSFHQSSEIGPKRCGIQLSRKRGAAAASGQRERVDQKITTALPRLARVSPMASITSLPRFPQLAPPKI